MEQEDKWLKKGLNRADIKAAIRFVLPSIQNTIIFSCINVPTKGRLISFNSPVCLVYSKVVSDQIDHLEFIFILQR